jgi:hypothetical protein
LKIVVSGLQDPRHSAERLQLNEVEPVFRQVKYHEMPLRSYTTRLGLREAVEEAFTGYGQRLRPKRTESLCPAA